ncbi:MAG: DUF192 domain-containing protein [Bdellovibrionales bacterium]|jgi:uncharacterized membrane protein (UPF0127 family)|nr:DUF192 domain-containing protein [Bdellovibrionales bacterium]
MATAKFWWPMLSGLLAFLITVPMSSVEASSTPDSVAPKFAVREIQVGTRKIKVEIADTDDKRAFGLMFRTKLEENTGMLFIFDETRQLSFWMKNTLIPLSIAYIGEDLVIQEILDMQPAVIGVARPKSYPSRQKAKYALEMNVGWFEKNQIRPGVRLKIADN